MKKERFEKKLNKNKEIKNHKTYFIFNEVKYSKKDFEIIINKMTPKMYMAYSSTRVGFPNPTIKTTAYNYPKLKKVLKNKNTTL